MHSLTTNSKSERKINYNSNSSTKSTESIRGGKFVSMTACNSRCGVTSCVVSLLHVSIKFSLPRSSKHSRHRANAQEIMEIPSNWHSRRNFRRRAESTSCPNCKDFDWDELQRHAWDTFFTRPEDIAHSAAKGCATCQILSKAVEHCYPAVASDPSGYKIAFHGLDGPMHWDVVGPGEDVLDATRQNNFIEIFSDQGLTFDVLVGCSHMY